MGNLERQELPEQQVAPDDGGAAMPDQSFYEQKGSEYCAAGVCNSIADAGDDMPVLTDAQRAKIKAFNESISNPPSLPRDLGIFAAQAFTDDGTLFKEAIFWRLSERDREQDANKVFIKELRDLKDAYADYKEGSTPLEDWRFYVVSLNNTYRQWVASGEDIFNVDALVKKNIS